MKQAVIILRASPETKKLLQEKAKGRELSLSKYMLYRALINKDLTAHEKQNLTNLILQIKKIGINLNQITRIFNAYMITSVLTEENKERNIKDLSVIIDTLQNNHQLILDLLNKLL